MDVCDPDAKTKNIRKLIKLHTGHTVDVSRERMCDITREAKKGNLPMPPLVLTRDKRFLLDSKSPLTQKDYETLYKSNTTSAVVKRLAKKVGLVNTDKTIADLKDAIGRRLASTGVREPILLPGSRAVSAPKSENFFVNANRDNVQNENRNNVQNENRNNENRNRANINSARRNNGGRPNGNVVKPNSNVVKPNGNRPKSVKNAIRNRHRDRIKDFGENRREPNRREPNRREPNGKKPGFFGRLFGGSKNTSTNKLNTEMKLAKMKRNTQRQVSHQKTVQSRLRLREAKLAKNMISEAEREKRQAINDVTRMQNNKHLLEVELNRRANRARKNAETVSRSKKELAKEKLHAGELNTRIAALRRRATVEREQVKKNLNETKTALGLAMNSVNSKTKNIGLKQSEINKVKVNLNAASKKADAYKRSVDSQLAKIQELTKKLEAAGNAGNSEKVKTLETQITKLLKELEELKKKPVTVVQNAELIAKKIELTRLAGVQGVNFTKNINKLTMNNVRGTVLKNNFGKNTQTKLAPKVLALENKIRAAGKAKKAKKNAELAAIETKRREEMNIIRAEKEKAITNAAANKATAVKEAEAAAKAQAMANTEEERAKAQANLQAAQVKINAANEEKTKALEKAKEEREQALATAANNKEAALAAAKTERNTALKKATNNKQKAIKGLRDNRNLKLKNAQTKINAAAANKQKALKNAKTERNATLKKAMNNKKKAIEGLRANRNKKLEEIREEKNKAQSEANAARKALVAGRFQSAANKAVLEKRVTEAQVKINAANEEKTKALEKAKQEREQALATAANNKEAALAAAKTERNTALKKATNNKQKAIKGLRDNRNLKLKNAQTKINAAAANKQKALKNAKTERNATLKKAMNNKKKAIEGLRANRNKKLEEIREEKNKALAEAAANKNKAQSEANAARKALVAGRFQSAANKAALEKRVTEAEANIKRAATEKVEALEEAERKRKEALEKAESNKKNAIKGAVAFNRMKGAINAKKKNARTSIQNRLRAKAQQARNTVEKRKKAQVELRALANTKGVNFTSNINRVTLNGVNVLKNRIIKAGKAKANANAARTLAQFKANRKKAKENANRLAREKAEKAKQEMITKAKAAGEEKRKARQMANEARTKQNARNAEANKIATARRIALEKKQAAAKQRREMQEQGRGKRNAEREAAKADAKKEKNNTNARMKTTRNKLAANKKVVSNLVGGAIKKAEADARMNAIVVIKRDYANTVYGAGKLITNKERAHWIQQGNQMGLDMSYGKKTEKNFAGLKKMFMDNLNRVKRNKNIKNAKNAASTKIQAAYKGAQVRKSVGGSSMGQNILKKHISGINVMAGQSIPGFTGKRLEDGGYEKKWLQRVDEEGDTAVKRAKLKKMFDDKFELKKTLLKNEKTNVRTGYRLGQLRSLKSQVMRPFYRQDSSTKGTDRNAAALNVVRIDKQIDEAKSAYAKKILDQQAINMKKAGQKFKTSGEHRRQAGAFVRLGAGGNKNINGVNMTLKRAKPSLKNITTRKVIRPARMAGNSLLKAGQITQAKKNAVGNVAGARKAYANQAKFAIEQKKKRAKQRVVNSLKGKAGKNQSKYMKMINAGQINQAMKEVDKKVGQHPGLKIQPKLT